MGRFAGMTAPYIPDRPAALFLDFDGTLVELAETPDGVDVPPRLAWLLGRLSARVDGALAFITGRSIADLDTLLKAPAFAAAGVHGGEWRQADGDVETHDGEPFDKERETVAAFAAQDERFIVEQKSGGITIHFRRAPEREADAETAMRDAFADRPDFEILSGHMMWEARRVGVHKGAGIERLMAKPPFTGRTPIFIGDDRTDEDGFATINEMGGLSIKVGEGETLATARLPDIPAVYAYLERLAAPGSDFQ
ncbi:MAG: trehalose-phosphatase [Pseudomonadota bacterium]